MGKPTNNAQNNEPTSTGGQEEIEKVTVRFSQNVKLDQERYKKGSKAEVTEAQAKQLVLEGLTVVEDKEE